MLNQHWSFSTWNIEKGKLHNSIFLPTLRFGLNQLCFHKSMKEKESIILFAIQYSCVWLASAPGQKPGTSEFKSGSASDFLCGLQRASEFLCCSSYICTLTLQKGTCFVCAGFSQTQNSNWLWEPFSFYCVLNTYALSRSLYLPVDTWYVLTVVTANVHLLHICIHIPISDTYKYNKM